MDKVGLLIIKISGEQTITNHRSAQSLLLTGRYHMTRGILKSGAFFQMGVTYSIYDSVAPEAVYMAAFHSLHNVSIDHQEQYRHYPQALPGSGRK